MVGKPKDLYNTMGAFPLKTTWLMKSLGPLIVLDVMASSSSLKDLWKTGKKGSLSPLEQSRAWALREVYRENGIPEKKLYTQVAGKLFKIGKNGKKGDHPTPMQSCNFSTKSIMMRNGTQVKLRRVVAGSQHSML